MRRKDININERFPKCFLPYRGQNLASQIQQTNPELIEQLRQMRGGQQPPGENPTPSNTNSNDGQNGGSEGGNSQSKEGSDSSPAS